MQRQEGQPFIKLKAKNLQKDILVNINNILEVYPAGTLTKPYSIIYFSEDNHTAVDHAIDELEDIFYLSIYGEK